eukprot:6265560-Prymnesium_polylepis.3
MLHVLERLYGRRSGRGKSRRRCVRALWVQHVQGGCMWRVWVHVQGACAGCALCDRAGDLMCSRLKMRSVDVLWWLAGGG